VLLWRRGSLDAVAATTGALAGAAGTDVAMLARRLRKSGLKLLIHDPQPDIRALIEYVGLHRLPGVKVFPAGAPASA
jgi:hypothetical protein